MCIYISPCKFFINYINIITRKIFCLHFIPTKNFKNFIFISKQIFIIISIIIEKYIISLFSQIIKCFYCIFTF